MTLRDVENSAKTLYTWATNRTAYLCVLLHRVDKMQDMRDMQIVATRCTEPVGQSLCIMVTLSAGDYHNDETKVQLSVRCNIDCVGLFIWSRCSLPL
jgi:hypothetical protein